MGNSASKVGTKESNHSLLISHSPSKLKSYAFATAIIVGIGGLGIAAAGVAGYFHVGALSNMAQVDAIIMMAGGGSGIFLLLIGVLGSLKNCQVNGFQTVEADFESISNSIRDFAY